MKRIWNRDFHGIDIFVGRKRSMNYPRTASPFFSASSVTSFSLARLSSIVELTFFLELRTVIHFCLLLGKGVWRCSEYSYFMNISVFQLGTKLRKLYTTGRVPHFEGQPNLVQGRDTRLQDTVQYASSPHYDQPFEVPIWGKQNL